MYVAHYEQGSYNNHVERRERKLLLNRREIRKIQQTVKQPGFSIVPTLLYIDDKDVEVTSIENAEGNRVYECPVVDIKTIWAKSLDTLSRIGLSIDHEGNVISHKIEVEQEFIISIGDVGEVNGLKFRVYGIKTLERNMKKGFAYARVIKRIYGKLLSSKDKSKVKYDLTEYVVKTTSKEKNYN